VLTCSVGQHTSVPQHSFDDSTVQRAWWQSALCCKLSAALDDSKSHILKLSLAQTTRHSTHRVSVNQYAGRFLHWHHSIVRCYCLLLLLSAALEDKESHPLKLTRSGHSILAPFTHTHCPQLQTPPVLLLGHPYRPRCHQNDEMWGRTCKETRAQYSVRTCVVSRPWACSNACEYLIS
jgi:hypothetical protein